MLQCPHHKRLITTRNVTTDVNAQVMTKSTRPPRGRGVEGLPVGREKKPHAHAKILPKEIKRRRTRRRISHAEVEG